MRKSHVKWTALTAALKLKFGEEVAKLNELEI